MHTLLFPAINLAVLVAILVKYLREPTKTFVRVRHETLRDELRRVRDMLTGAKIKYDEFSSKLKAMEAEIEAMREQARQDASASKAKILVEAQGLAATVIADSRRAAQGLYGQLRGELFVEVGAKVLDRTEALLRERLTGDDRARIRHEFSAQVEGAR